MGTTEVTQKQWTNVIGDTISNPSQNKGDSLPVGQVTWFNAIAFCNALSRKEGLAPCYIGDDSSGWVFDYSQNGNMWREGVSIQIIIVLPMLELIIKMT